MKVIGLVGPKSSGKDTTFELLEKLKKVDGKISFATPLKQICSKVFEIAPVMFHDVILKERELKQPVLLTAKHLRAIRDLCEQYVDPLVGDTYKYNPNSISLVGLEGRQLNTPREILQVIGTDFIRNRVYKKFHTEAAFSEEAARRVKKNGIYCVTDVRFVDEHLFLMDKFGADYKAFYVSRPEADSLLAAATHQSELETQKIREILAHSVIDNSGSLDELETLLKTVDFGFEVATKTESKFKYARRSDSGE